MIAIEHCTKYFHRGSVNEVLALNDIGLQVASGDFITVIGSNGAGKSTLLNALAGSFLLDSGTITIGNLNITRWPEYKRAKLIARVFQDPLLGTCPSATIEQNVGLLSGGQRQALTMLMATLVRPEVLLLDEHIAALDPKTAGQILSLTREIVAEQGLTTLMITHNMKHAIEFGNRLIMLHQGRIILDVSGEKKRSLSVDDLLHQFYKVQGEELANDSMLLT
ncbi:MAG: ATP-binding cassette domain-containing protein [Desulfofustis sp.]